MAPNGRLMSMKMRRGIVKRRKKPKVEDDETKIAETEGYFGRMVDTVASWPNVRGFQPLLYNFENKFIVQVYVDYWNQHLGHQKAYLERVRPVE